jgi:hypothetical protein
MARTRNIKPSFFDNDILAECDPLARIAFAGLWCHADREGRMEYRPKRLKANILPYDDCDFDALIQELADRGFVHLYRCAGVAYLQVSNFSKHQNPHQKEAESMLPAPPVQDADNIKETASTGQAPDKHGASTDNAPDEPGLNLTSLTLNPSPNHADPASEFEQFWAEYPRKENKGQAEKAFPKARKLADLDTLIDGARRLAKSGKERQYMPHPASWLNGKRWLDEPMPASTGPPQKQSKMGALRSEIWGVDGNTIEAMANER